MKVKDLKRLIGFNEDLSDYLPWDLYLDRALLWLVVHYPKRMNELVEYFGYTGLDKKERTLKRIGEKANRYVGGSRHNEIIGTGVTQERVRQRICYIIARLGSPSARKFCLRGKARNQGKYKGAVKYMEAVLDSFIIGDE